MPQRSALGRIITRSRHPRDFAFGHRQGTPVSDLLDGRAASFEEIARREGKVERHLRFLAPLAFLSPRIVEAIARGEDRPDLTVTMLARALPHRWAEQESKLGIA
jgi:site-specific DNA recombinase